MTRCSTARSGGLLVPLLLVAALAGVSCSRVPATTAPASDQPGPRETLQRIMELRATSRYKELPAYIVPRRGAEVVDFLLAVDAFMAANGRLCNWLRTHVGLGLSQTIDQAYVADDLSIYAGENLGVFSRSVELLDESVTSDVATVTYTTENRLPAKTVRLRRLSGRWLFDPGAPLSPHLAAAFHDMARGLEQVLAELHQGRPTTQQLLDSPEPLQEKVMARLRRGVGLLSKAQLELAPTKPSESTKE